MSRAETKAYRAKEDSQLAFSASFTPLERLRWLQQAKEFAQRFQGAARRVVASNPKHEKTG